MIFSILLLIGGLAPWIISENPFRNKPILTFNPKLPKCLEMNERGRHAHNPHYRSHASSPVNGEPRNRFEVTVPKGNSNGSRNGFADYLKEETPADSDPLKPKLHVTIRELKPNSNYGRTNGPGQLQRYGKAWLKKLSAEPNGPCLVKLELFLDFYKTSRPSVTPNTATPIDHDEDENDGDDIHQ